MADSNQLKADQNLNNSMDRRKKRTSLNQYLMYIKMLEDDEIFRTGNIPRDIDINYITSKWKDLSDKLNTCTNGPSLTAEEWKKRLNDWKNSTRCKYRRSQIGEKDISLTPLETKALNLFGKAPASCPIIKNLKIESKSELEIEQNEMANEVSEHEDAEQMLIESIVPTPTPPRLEAKPRVIHVQQPEMQPKISVQHEPAVNGNDFSGSAAKRLRVEDYTATASTLDGSHHISIPLEPLMNISDGSSIAVQLKRLADAKEEKLKFEIAKFKFKNPGFDFIYPPQF